MVGYIEKSTGGDFTPTPEGQHLMVCSRIIDLGTQPGSPMYPSPKRKIRIFWELPDERMKMTDDRGGEKDVPVLHSEQYTVSFHEKANLRKVLEQWRGKAFVETDFAGPPDGFHLAKLIGIPAFGQIVHEHSDGKTYANLNSIMKPPREMFEKYKGRVEGETVFFDLDDFKQDVFDKLSDRVKETIKGSPEFKALFGDGDPQRQNGHAQSQREPERIDDEIPF